MKKVILAFLVLILVYSPNLFSQLEPPIKWGEISKEDLQMKSFPQDSNASAVILCDYGESVFDNELDIIYSRHLRVKILNQNGYGWGTRSIIIYTEDDAEDLYDIKGITYMLNENGEITETELDDDDIFEEEISDNTILYKFTMPNMLPGCIIDIHYKIVATSFARMRDWTFQHDEPVRWSEYRIRTPRSIGYAIVNLGFEPWEFNESEEVSQVFSSSAAVYLGNTIVPCMQYRWAVKDLPALRDEPYTTTIDDYTNRLQVQLSGFALRGTGLRQFLNSWENLVERLIESDGFYAAIDDTKLVSETAGKITAGITSPKEKMIAIYNWVKSSIVWSGETRMFAEQDVDDVIETKKGNNAEITFLLLSLLKSVGLSGDPIILSTRSHGRIHDLYPIYDQFNYTIARVNAGTESFFLDATNPLRPYDLLPMRVLNVKGLVIKEGKLEWVIINSKKKNIDYSLTVINVKEDGSIDGNFDDSFIDFSAVELRDELHDKKDLDIGKEVFDVEAEGILLDSVKIMNRDSIEAPLRVTAWFASSDYAQKSGDMIYLNPEIIHRYNENPFKSSVRKFPIDYGHQSGLTKVINIIIPEGYEVKDTLKNKSFSVGNSASYSRLAEVSGNKIQIASKLEIKESQIDPKLYDRLKTFYARIVEAQAEQIVLARKKESANQPDASSMGTGK